MTSSLSEPMRDCLSEWRPLSLTDLSAFNECHKVAPSPASLSDEFIAMSAVLAAVHADRVPAPQRGIFQHRRLDASGRPQARSNPRQFRAHAALARLLD